MKKIIIILILFIACAVFRAEAQYGFGTNQPDPQALIDAKDPNKGMLVPRVSLQGLTDPSPFNDSPSGTLPVSMLVWNTGTGGLTPLTPSGFYYWSGTGSGWKRLVIASDIGGATTPGNLTSSTLDISGGSGAVLKDVTVNVKGVQRWFYMPGIPINTATLRNGDTLDLYAVYSSQFSNIPAARNSTGSLSSIPVYARTELDYYVIGFDSNVFRINSVSSTAPVGIMNYDVISNATACSFINVVFVIK